MCVFVLLIEDPPPVKRLRLASLQCSLYYDDPEPNPQCLQGLPGYGVGIYYVMAMGFATSPTCANGSGLTLC